LFSFYRGWANCKQAFFKLLQSLRLSATELDSLKRLGDAVGATPPSQPDVATVHVVAKCLQWPVDKRFPGMASFIFFFSFFFFFFFEIKVSCMGELKMSDLGVFPRNRPAPSCLASRANSDFSSHRCPDAHGELWSRRCFSAQA
jgi:hypothetical protein